MNDAKTAADRSAIYPGFDDATPAAGVAPAPTPAAREEAGRWRADLGMFVKLVVLILLAGVPLLIGSILYGG